MSEKSNFEKLAAIDVGAYIEKKGNLSYLSWPFAVDQLMRHDPMANWEYGEPVKWGDTVMVFCTVTAFGKRMTSQLPVMDNRNKAISNPDSFAINTAMQRCLVKAIALHGLGLYIYAGEDVPREEVAPVDFMPLVKMIDECATLDDLKATFKTATEACGADKEALKNVIKAKDTRKAQLQKAAQNAAN